MNTHETIDRLQVILKTICDEIGSLKDKERATAAVRVGVLGLGAINQMLLDLTSLPTREQREKARGVIADAEERAATVLAKIQEIGEAPTAASSRSGGQTGRRFRKLIAPSTGSKHSRVSRISEIGMCPQCRQAVTVRKTGVFRWHKMTDPMTLERKVCEGSGNVA